MSQPPSSKISPTKPGHAEGRSTLWVPEPVGVKHSLLRSLGIIDSGLRIAQTNARKLWGAVKYDPRPTGCDEDQRTHAGYWQALRCVDSHGNGKLFTARILFVPGYRGPTHGRNPLRDSKSALLTAPFAEALGTGLGSFDSRHGSAECLKLEVLLPFRWEPKRSRTNPQEVFRGQRAHHQSIMRRPTSHHWVVATLILIAEEDENSSPLSPLRKLVHRSSQWQV